RSGPGRVRRPRRARALPPRSEPSPLRSPLHGAGSRACSGWRSRRRRSGFSTSGLSVFGVRFSVFRGRRASAIRSSARSVSGSLPSWEEDGEACAALGGVVDEDGALVGFEGTVDDGEAEAGSAWARRVERVEDARAVLLGNAGPGISDDDAHGGGDPNAGREP